VNRPDRYAEMFERLRAADEGAFVPYLTLGDPSPSRSIELARRLLEGGGRGADALELGIPFSDPIADGPAIQASAQRAIGGGTTPELALETAAAIRDEHPQVPLGLLVYSNLAVRHGVESFFGRVAGAGFDSVLVADLPAMEAEPFHRAATSVGLDFVLIVPPNASEETLRSAAERTSGYVYVVTREGPTGAERAARAAGHPHFEALRRRGAPPALVGFGVSEPRHVEEALRAGAAGAISGSAVARRIEEHLGDREAMLAAVGSFVSEMKAAAHDVELPPREESP